MKSSSTTLFPETTSPGPDPRKRLSLAVKELTRLITHANQIADLADQPFPAREEPRLSSQEQTFPSNPPKTTEQESL